jgi:hypothetical protein
MPINSIRSNIRSNRGNSHREADVALLSKRVAVNLIEEQLSEDVFSTFSGTPKIF